MRSVLFVILSASSLWALPAVGDDALVRDSLAMARPDARVPQVQYQSSFTGYSYRAEEGVGRWREMNDLVHRLGGWAAFAKGLVPDDAEPAGATRAIAPGPKDPPTAQKPHGSHGER